MKTFAIVALAAAFTAMAFSPMALAQKQQCQSSCSESYTVCANWGSKDACTKAKASCMKTGTFVGPVTGQQYKDRCKR